MININMEAGELRHVAAAARGAHDATGDLSPVFAGPIDRSLTEFFRRMFESRGALGGERWAPHRRATAEWRRRRGTNAGGVDAVLWDTGDAKASMEGRGPNAVREVRAASYTRGSSDRVLAIHQAGYTMKRWGRVRYSRYKSKPREGTAGRRRVPPRRVIPKRLPRSLTRGWEQAMLDYMHQASGVGSTVRGHTGGSTLTFRRRRR